MPRFHLGADTDEQRIAAYYDRLVKVYGHDPRSCDASTTDSLLCRYKALSEVMDLSDRSVLEVGCGLGDLGSYLREKYQRLRYTGVDISPKMIEEAKRVYPGHDFFHASLLDLDSRNEADVVIAQGIFYLLGEGAEVKMHKLIQKMFALCRQAVAFSTLSSWATRQSTSEFYADPSRLLEWCRGVTRSVVFRHDYHPGDFAIYLYKGKE